MAKKLAIEKDAILWKDRKRFLGLPISFTRFETGSERLILRKGFFRTQVDELLLYRIMDIKMVRTLGQKIFGVGTITLISTDKLTPVLELKNIRQPDNVRRFLSSLIDKQRIARGISGSEFLGAGRFGHGFGYDHEPGQSHSPEQGHSQGHGHDADGNEIQ